MPHKVKASWALPHHRVCFAGPNKEKRPTCGRGALVPGRTDPQPLLMDRTRMPDERDCRCIKKGTAAQRCYFRGWLVGG